MASTMLVRCGQRWSKGGEVVKLIDDRIYEGRVVDETCFLAMFEERIGHGAWISEAELRRDYAFVDGLTEPEMPEESRARVLAIEESNVPKRANKEAWVRVVRSFPMSSHV